MAYPHVNFQHQAQQIGLQPIGVASVAQQHPLGMLAWAVDATYGDASFLYLKGAATTAAGDVVCYNTLTGATVRVLQGTTTVGLVAIAMSACGAGMCGWYQVSGAGPAKSSSVVAGVAAYLSATTGQVDDDTSNTGIAGMVVETTASGGFTTVQFAAASLGSVGGGGGDSLWTEYDANTAKLGTYKNALVKGSNSNSRDNPVAGLIARNEGLANNPQFLFGNPYIAGVGFPASGVWYIDDTQGGQWKISASYEKSGTFATVLDGVERSAYESFGENGQFKPWMRAEMSSRAINFGSSCKAAPGDVSRTSNVVTVVTTNPHRMAVGDQLWRTTDAYDGNVSDLTLFGPESSGSADYTITVVVDAHTFKYAHTGANGTSAGGILYSKETDVGFGRDATGLAAIRVNGSSVVQANEFGLCIPGDLSILASGAALPIGAAGVASIEATADMLHVLEGKTFFQEGTYKSTGWYNGGGQTQTTQEVFNVGTGSGNQTTYLRAIGGVDWMRLMVRNDGEGAAHTLTITPQAGETIKGAASLTIPAYAACTLVSAGTDWAVYYHPAPP